ncbi:MAG: DUF2865 domain-containing protein [Rhizobiales bacterium]|nr:DUF2865 domain-containing protein [Hyphomicrobiales bacterium]
MRRVRLCSMNKTVMRTLLRRAIPAALAAAVCATAAQAQPPLPPPASQRSPVCVRLEGQLGMVDRGGQADPQRAEQIRRYEETAHRQQAEIDRLAAQGRKMGCEGRGFFSLFGGQPPQCGPINNQIQQMRANLDRVLADLQRLQGNSGDREGERRAILASLAQNDCGPQYRQYANRGGGGFFENLFGGGTIIEPGAPPPGSPVGDTYRTVCVRTCDGYYFPISYSTTPASFPQDEQTCQRMCPAAEVALYSHRNPGEDIAQAISTGGRSYSELPNAFAFRKAFNPSCSCRAPGQTWADALKHLEDYTVEQGDIVVTEEQAKALSQPKNAPAAKGKGAQPKSAPAAQPPTTSAAAPKQQRKGENGKPQVRTVGPPFIPAN